MVFLIHYGEFPYDMDADGRPDISTLWDPSYSDFAPIYADVERILLKLLDTSPARRASVHHLRANGWPTVSA